jgi:hypothetical protein
MHSPCRELPAIPAAERDSLPREHQIVAVPIQKARDLATIESMLRLVHNVGSQASDRLGLDVFWLHRGRLHPLHAEAKNGQLEQIFPPDEFRRLMEQLPRDQKAR